MFLGEKASFHECPGIGTFLQNGPPYGEEGSAVVRLCQTLEAK